MRNFRDTSDVETGEKLESARLPDEVGEGAEADRLPDEVKEKKDIPERMHPPVVIEFNKCPERMNPVEYTRQRKGQERGMNSLFVAEFLKNCHGYKERKEMSTTGNGRALEGAEAQKRAREKAIQSRIASNMEKKKMSYKDAENEAKSWIKTQAALHNPDQIAGGNPGKVSGMGDAKVNESIGSQWRSRVEQLISAVEKFAKGYTNEELEQIKMNVRLEESNE